MTPARPASPLSYVAPATAAHTIFVMGIHGAGKSTLLSAVSRAASVHTHSRLDVPVLTDDPFARVVARMVKYYLESHAQRRARANQPDARFLADRCVYDSLAYANAFRDLGWLTASQRRTIDGLFLRLFDNSVLPRHVVFLDPPHRWVERRLRERWARTGKVGWREGDRVYLEATARAYRHLLERSEFCAPVDVLTVRETDLGARVRAVLSFCRAAWGADLSHPPRGERA